MQRFLKRTVVMMLILSMSALGLPTLGIAAPIDTQAMIEIDERAQLVSKIQRQLAHEEVRAQFLAHGVQPAEVDARIAALSYEELQLLAQQLDEQPAGGSLLAVIGVVFVVLVILDLVGATNVFSNI